MSATSSAAAAAEGQSPTETKVSSSVEQQGGVKGKERSLWERMGGANTIEPMVHDIYDRHATDPLTARWFAKSNREKVIRRVIDFFSAGIGGPFQYDDQGKSLAERHRGMKIDDAAMHAIIYHNIEQMAKHKAGGAKEREEVIKILYSLQAEVTKYNNE